MNRQPNWGVPSHSSPERNQVSRIVGGLAAATVTAVTVSIAMSGGTNVGYVNRAAPQSKLQQIELRSRSLARAPFGTQISGTDTNGTTTENAVLTAQISSADVNGATTENTTLTVQITNSDTNGATSEIGNSGQAAAIPIKAIRAVSAHSPPDRQLKSIIISALAIGPLPAIIPPAIALQGFTNQNRTYRPVQQPPPQEYKGPAPGVFVYYNAPPPIYSVILQGKTNQWYQFQASKAYTNEQTELKSRIFKIVTTGSSPSSSDANGTTTETGTLTAQISSPDASGATTENAQVSVAGLISFKTRGIDQPDSQAVKSQSRIYGFYTTRIDVNASDVNGATTENTTLAAQVSSTDVDGSTTENNTLAAQISDTDAGSGVESQQSSISGVAGKVVLPIKPFTYAESKNDSRIYNSFYLTRKSVNSADTNGATTENASFVVSVSVSDTNSTATEGSSLIVSSTNSDSSTGTNAETLKVVIGQTDTGASTEGQTGGPNQFDVSSSDFNGPIVEAASAIEIVLTGGRATGRITNVQTSKGTVIVNKNKIKTTIRRIN